jgi:hypothetical protein
VQAALPGVERVFAAAPDFDPGSSTREFTLLISDYSIAVLGDAIARLLAGEAPGARLRFLPNSPQSVDDAPQVLVNADLLVLPHGFLIADLPHRDLYRDKWVCLVATGNDEVGDALTTGQLETLPGVVTYHAPSASTPAARQLRTPGDGRPRPRPALGRRSPGQGPGLRGRQPGLIVNSRWVPWVQ